MLSGHARLQFAVTCGSCANIFGVIKVDKLGRELFRPDPNGDPPYILRDPSDAEDEEFEQCHRIWGRLCNPDAQTVIEDGLTAGLMADSRALPGMHISSKRPRGLRTDAKHKTGATIVKMSNLLAIPPSLAGRRSADLIALSSSTLARPTPFCLLRYILFRPMPAPSQW